MDVKNPDGSWRCVWKANRESSCETGWGDDHTERCPRRPMEHDEDVAFTFIPADEADFIMMTEEYIRVTGAPPYRLSPRDRNGLVIYSRLRSRKLDEEKARNSAGPGITGGRGR